MDEFEKALSPVVQSMRVIIGAMCMGLLMMAGVTVMLSLKAQGKVPPAGDGALPVLSAVHAFMVVSSYAMGWFLTEQQYKASRGTTAASAPERIQTAEIMLWATREGPALLGFVVCFLAGTSGIAARQPLYWLNASSTLLFWGLALNNFPSEERYREIYRTKLQGGSPSGL
jgi:hypothetical protein